MDITKRRNIFPHVSAANQSSNAHDIILAKGKLIQYIYTDSQNQNPLNRVIVADSSLDDVGYDREKYKDLLLDAAETGLSIFGFDRTHVWKGQGQKVVDGSKAKPDAGHSG